MNKFTVIIGITFSLVSFAACESEYPIQKRVFPLKNIPKHVFNFPADKLRDTIITLFSLDNGKQYHDSVLIKIFYDAILNDKNMPCTFSVETSKDTIFSKKYFSNPKTANDLFLCSLGSFWFSKYYYSKDQPLEFISNFAIKFKKVDDSFTEVQIVADDPQVINGTKCCGFHGTYSKYTPVEPTLIEEYTLLQYIASKLGDTTLSPIKVPIIK